jgi:ribosomal protein S18 acetylase RimI-like enzyme
MAGELEPFAHGTVLRTPLAPDYWDVNTVRVEGSDPGFGADALIALADELQDGLRHRRVEVEDERLGARVRPDLRAAGWLADRLVFMHRAGPPPAWPDGVEEVPFVQTRALRMLWHDSERWGDEEALHLESQEAVAARTGVRAFAVPEGGELVGFAALLPGAGAAEITELFVAPAHRRRGLGARLVAAALAAGGHASNWIVADDEGRPKRLYERLGFRAVWRLYSFIRLPEDPD